MVLWHAMALWVGLWCSGMLGPLLSNLPATLPGQNVPQPPSAPRPNFAPVPGQEPGRAFSDVLPKAAPTKDQSVTGAMANGEAYDGQYTGELLKGKPDGEGTLAQEPVFSKQDRALKLAIERVAPLREAYLKVKAQHDKMADYKVVDPERAAQIAPGVEQQLRKAETALNSARADVAALDPPNVADYTVLYREAKTNIFEHQLFAEVAINPKYWHLFGWNRPAWWTNGMERSELREIMSKGASKGHLDRVSKWAPRELGQSPEFAFLSKCHARWTSSILPFASGTPYTQVEEGDSYTAEQRQLLESLGAYFKPGDLERYAEALKRGEVDFDYPEVSATTREVTGSWYQGQLVAGEIRAEKPLKGGSTLRVSTLIKDNRPFGDTEHQVSLREETRNREGQLAHKIFAETTEKVVDWWGGVTLNLGGRMRWSARPTAHKFAWAAPMEQVVMRDGKGTLVVDPEAEKQVNPTLSGSAEVRLTVAATGEHVMLYGEMKDNKLLGLVKTSTFTRRFQTYAPLPDIDLPPGEDGVRYFFVDGYDESGAPVVRRPTKPTLLGIRNTQQGWSQPPFDKDLDELDATQASGTEGGWSFYWWTTFAAVLIGLYRTLKS